MLSQSSGFNETVWRQFHWTCKAWWLWKHETGSSLYLLILFDPIICIICSTKALFLHCSYWLYYCIIAFCFFFFVYIYILQVKANKLTLLVFGFLRKRTLYRYSILINILHTNFFRFVVNVLTCIVVVASLRVQLMAKVYFWKVATAKAWKRFFNWISDAYFKLFKIAVVFWLEYFVVLSVVGITEVYFREAAGNIGRKT